MKLLSLSFLVIWLGGTFFFMVVGLADLFARFGAMGSIGGLLFAYQTEKFKDENSPDLVEFYEASLDTNTAKIAALTHQNSQISFKVLCSEKIAVGAAIFATIQWGFGDLAMNKLRICGQMLC